MNEKSHAVVIGSGFGGLAAAVRLGARGYRVTVLERLDQPGGRARVFRENGFVFDAGPTVITAPFLLEELWELCGRRMEDEIDLRPVDPFYRIQFDDGSEFEYTGSADRMRAELEPDGLNLLQATRAVAFQTVFHLHVHVIPRWAGDTNFMAVFGDVRVIPKTLGALWQEVRDAGAEMGLPEWDA